MSRPAHRCGDRGSATIYAAAVGLVCTLAGLAVAALGGRIVAEHQAQVAADFGALAGAAVAVQGRDVACARARQFADLNGAQLVSCLLDGFDVLVTVRVGSVHATARAGPVSMHGGEP